MRDRGRRWPGRLLAVGVVLLPVLLIAGLWACHVMRQTPFMAGPQRVAVCSRFFEGPGSVFRRQQLSGMQRIGTVMTWQGRREIWGHHTTIGGAAGCGTGVYLRTAANTFRGYALLGGP